MTAKVVLYGTKFCPYCIAARSLLNANSITFDDIAVDNDFELRSQIAERSGQHTVPQIWFGERHIGGYTDLHKLAAGGELDSLLAKH